MPRREPPPEPRQFHARRAARPILAARLRLLPEEAVATRGFRPPRIAVHSANASAREKMLAGVRAIARLAG